MDVIVGVQTLQDRTGTSRDMVETLQGQGGDFTRIGWGHRGTRRGRRGTGQGHKART